MKALRPFVVSLIISSLLAVAFPLSSAWASHCPPGQHDIITPIGTLGCALDSPAGGQTNTGGQASDTLGTIKFPSQFNLNANSLLNNLVGLFIAIAGLVFFFMLLYGGVRYMTAGGDPKNSEAARKTITNALIGLLIVVAAYFITFVL